MGTASFVFNSARLFFASDAIPSWMFGVLDIGLSLNFLLEIAFLAVYPRPIRRGSSAVPFFVLFAAFGIVAAIASERCIYFGCAQVEDDFFGGFSSMRNLLFVLAWAFALWRLPEIANESERRSAGRILTSMQVVNMLFLGYSLVQYATFYAGVTYQARYHFRGSWSVSDAVNFACNTFAAIVAFRRGARRLVWTFLAAGVAIFGLDQLTRTNLIDVGVSSLVLPLVVLYEVTRWSALGVTRIPARMAIPLGAASGLAVLIGLLAFASLIAPGDAFWSSLALVVGLVAGAGTTWALRPRDISISVTRTPAGALPAASALSAGSLVARRYRLERMLGTGGQGSAWLARDTTIDRDVALKVLPPGGVREARMIGALRDAHVVQVHDVLESNEATVLVMEYVEGGDLRSLIERRGRLAPAEADAIMRDVLSGLAAVHARGLVHGDVKPANILLDERGRAKIADFGLARRPDAATIVEGLGTLGYMAPERSSGGLATPASDVYAAGIVYREMLSGSRTDPGAPDPARAAVIRMALAVDPEERYRDARDMLAALPAA